MSVRQGLLALLAEQPMYGYQLRAEFERRTGGTWPLNIGQVYTTLSRLQRDGLVSEVDRHPDGSVVYALTDDGNVQAQQWWTTAVDRAAPGRDELVIKLALAVSTPGVDVEAVIGRQRTESLRALQGYTRLKRTGPPETGDTAWLLVLEHLIVVAEAEIRWLDHIESGLNSRPEPGSGRPERDPSTEEVAR